MGLGKDFLAWTLKAQAVKIKMTTPLVEMDGDEMTRVIWKLIKDILLIYQIKINALLFLPFSIN